MAAKLAASTAEFIGRLALGTAQFGLNYGINNTAGRPTDATVAEILQTARAAGMNLLDTAAAYGDSESRLGTWLSQQAAESVPFQLVTKLAAGPVPRRHRERATRPRHQGSSTSARRRQATARSRSRRRLTA